MEHLLEIKNIETCFKTDGQMVKAVDGVSLYLDPGEIIGDCRGSRGAENPLP